VIEIHPQSKIVLTHGAYLAATSENGHIAAVSRKGTGTLLSPDLRMLGHFSVPLRPTDLALSPDASELAVAAADGITLYSARAFEKSGYLNNAYQSCLFDTKGRLWSCIAYTQSSAILEIWDSRKETVIAEVKIIDPFGQSAFRLFRHPSQNSVIVWAAAGQDGQKLFWASLHEDAIQVTPFDDLDFTSPPAFRSDGKEFLIAAECELFRYAYPNGPRLSEMNELGPEEGDSIGDQVFYLDSDHALLSSSEGRLYTVDLAKMRTIDEVQILDDKPRPVWNFLKLDAQRFVSIHRDVQATNLDQAPDTLLLWAGSL